MMIRHGKCSVCAAGFTAYGNGDCSVVRLDATGKNSPCQMESGPDAGKTCPALRMTTGVANRPTIVRPPRLTEQDKRVFAALTQDFATSSDIAVKAKLPSRTRAELAEEICARLVKFGLAEAAKSRMKSLWRLKAG